MSHPCQTHRLAISGTGTSGEVVLRRLVPGGKSRTPTAAPSKDAIGSGRLG